jgi:antitoxin VapB
MAKAVRTSVFKSGNSVAVRLPKAFGFRPGDAVDLVETAGQVQLIPVAGAAGERQALEQLVERLRALGAAPVQDREEVRLDFPDRIGAGD